MLAADLEALRRQQVTQHPAACERILEMQLIHTPHDGKIGVRDGPRLVIDAAPADTQQLRLPRDRQIIGTIDHRFALSKPALPSAPSKKSFSSVSSPIFAWSDLISGEASVCIEATKGLNSYYLISDGGTMSYRTRIRTPSFPHLQMIPLMCRGSMVADLIAVLGSIDFVMADVDR